MRLVWSEYFVEYSLIIKKKSPHKTYVISLANGELQGYIVTKEACVEGGYEASNSLFPQEYYLSLVIRGYSGGKIQRGRIKKSHLTYFP